MDAYLADSAAVQDKCGLSRMHRSSSSAAASSSQSFGECSLCDEPMTGANSLDLGCSHRFCNGCWENWLVAALDKGPQALTTSCPGFKCREVIGDDTFLVRSSLQLRSH